MGTFIWFQAFEGPWWPFRHRSDRTGVWLQSWHRRRGNAGHLIEQIKQLPLQAFDFHGFKANRRVISYGWRYDFTYARLVEINQIPEWLFPLRKIGGNSQEVPRETLRRCWLASTRPELALGQGRLWPHGRSVPWCAVSTPPAQAGCQGQMAARRAVPRTWLDVPAKQGSTDRI